MEDKKVLLSVKDLEVKFHVRGRTLTAIRGISLDIYENESIAIVGESGSGKSVFTKTFAGMLDSNGFISNGDLVFNDAELDDTVVRNGNIAKFSINIAKKSLNKSSKLEFGADTYNEICKLKSDYKARFKLSEEENEKLQKKIDDLVYRRTEAYNVKQTLDSRKEKQRYKALTAEIAGYTKALKELEKRKKQVIAEHKRKARGEREYTEAYLSKLRELNVKYAGETSQEISAETAARNEVIAKEIYLSIGRYSNIFQRFWLLYKLVRALKKAMRIGVDLSDEKLLNAVFDNIAFRVKYLDETKEKLHGTCVLNLAKIKYTKDWQQIRGGKIATVFQDPMTSLNPIITIGKQISSIIIKHQHVSEVEARARAIKLMKMVGIPNAENRYDDYPFQYSGGMRQRIVIAIALSCQPKILICDEPTTALDVTIQAQILQLIKDLQKEFNYTIVFITHDLGVVAEMADRVLVLYAGKSVEYGTVDQIFNHPKHPYTKGLLKSIPRLDQNEDYLFAIEGVVPNQYNMPAGCRYCPRCPDAMPQCEKNQPPEFAVDGSYVSCFQYAGGVSHEK